MKSKLIWCSFFGWYPSGMGLMGSMCAVIWQMKQINLLLKWLDLFNALSKRSTVKHNSVLIVIFRVSESCVTSVFLHSPRLSRSVDRSQHAASDLQHSKGVTPCPHNTRTALVKVPLCSQFVFPCRRNRWNIFCLLCRAADKRTATFTAAAAAWWVFFPPATLLDPVLYKWQHRSTLCSPMLLWHLAVAVAWHWYYLEQ